MTEHEAKQLAADARLNAPSYLAAMNMVRDGIIKRLEGLPVNEQAAILGEHAKLHLLMEIDQAISSIIVNGEHAALTDALPGQ